MLIDAIEPMMNPETRMRMSCCLSKITSAESAGRVFKSSKATGGRSANQSIVRFVKI